MEIKIAGKKAGARFEFRRFPWLIGSALRGASNATTAIQQPTPAPRPLQQPPLPGDNPLNNNSKKWRRTKNNGRRYGRITKTMLPTVALTLVGSNRSGGVLLSLCVHHRTSRA